jgi:hypothetical protein
MSTEEQNSQNEKELIVIDFGYDPKNRLVNIITDGEEYWVEKKTTGYKSKIYKTECKTLFEFFGDQVLDSQN